MGNFEVPLKLMDYQLCHAIAQMSERKGGGKMERKSEMEFSGSTEQLAIS